MLKIKNKYDLENRTLLFAKNIIAFTHTSPKSIANIELVRQVTQSAGSVGANYIEANEALSKNDFVMRIKICRKEAKETGYWLQLTSILNKELLQEARELTKIFGAIVEKCT